MRARTDVRLGRRTASRVSLDLPVRFRCLAAMVEAQHAGQLPRAALLLRQQSNTDQQIPFRNR
jgi:hypothetical protein